MNTLYGQQEWRNRPRKNDQVVRPCDENERRARREKNARCEHTRENKKRTAKPKVEIRIIEI